MRDIRFQKRLSILFIIQILLFSCGDRADYTDLDSSSLIIIGQGPGDSLNYTSVAMDPSGDGEISGIDLVELRAASQNGWLMLYFKISSEIVLQRGNALSLLIDGDNNSGTGYQQNGIGAELRWDFGTRQGYWYGPTGDSVLIDQTNFAIRTAPTFSGTEFEVAISLDSSFDAEIPLFRESEVKIALWDQIPGGDRIPQSGALTIRIYPSHKIPVPSIPMARDDSSHFRILQHNVLEDGIIKRPEYFRNIYRAVAPDLFLLGEVYQAQPEEVLRLIEDWLPLDVEGQRWSAIRHQDGSMVVSRYPIEQVELSIPSTGDGFMIQLPPPWTTALLVVHAWAACCDQDSLRQEHCDQIMANIRDLKLNDITADTPIILAGDFNLVTWRQHYNTLRNGAIHDTTQFGPSFDPDSYAGSFVDLNPRLLTRPMDYTWRNDKIGFAPGRLDYIFYTGSSLGAGNNYIYEDEELPDSVLSFFNLKEGDAARASDHLPLVADFYPIIDPPGR